MSVKEIVCILFTQKELTSVIFEQQQEWTWLFFFIGQDGTETFPVQTRYGRESGATSVPRTKVQATNGQ